MPYKLIERRREYQKEYYNLHRDYVLRRTTAYRKAHYDQIMDAQIRWKKALRLEVLTYYSGGVPKCAHCGIDDVDVLCFDHINGGGTKDKRRTCLPFSLRREGYPEGFQVLCANCNMKKAKQIEIPERKRRRNNHE